MDDNQDEEIQEFMKEIADDLEYTPEQKETRRQKGSGDYRLSKKALFLGSACVVLLSVLIALLLGGGSGLSTKDLSHIQAKLDLLEKKLARLEGMESRIISLENQETELQQFIAEIDRSGRSTTEQLQKITEKVDELEKTVGSVPSKTKAPRPFQAKPAPRAEKRYHEVRPGDTLYRIAQKYRMSVRELCRLNNIAPDQAIHPGQKLLVAPDTQQ
ncbi:MAG: LysM peptidoglycan-binding domain-containing protein [Deltaproteobacteria bacterium]|nr:LysM peptidoglycan-binding domain-containing protein [Deltaproteobacteria bacterium]MBW2340125.1 LysM peptidoglycan-binding domain-containing protein [Deltaproteobacteria bacterium]